MRWMSLRTVMSVVLVAAALTGAVGYWGAGRHGEPQAQQPGAGPPLYQADPGWQLLPSGLRRQFESWHDMFTNLETSGQTQVANQYVSAIMSAPEDSSMKRLMAEFLADTRRVPYVEAMVAGANPSGSTGMTRMSLLCCAERIWLTDGSGAFSKNATSLIASYRDSRAETHPGAAFVLQRLAARLGL